MTLMNNCGFPEEEARQIETNYHNMYKVALDWANDKLDIAHDTGYVEVAFGLRVRTPILEKCAVSARMPFFVEAERRSAGNALTQSYGLLNSRVGVEVQKRTLKSKHRLDILPVAMIHDACYFLVRDNLDTVKWLNDNLIECMEWQDLPEIQHEEVKLGAELSVFYPTWAEELELPNDINQTTINQIAYEYKEKLK